MLLAFASEGVCVEGFNGVAKFNDAYGIEALDLSKARGCCLRCGMVVWVILQVIGIGCIRYMDARLSEKMVALLNESPGGGRDGGCGRMCGMMKGPIEASQLGIVVGGDIIPSSGEGREGKKKKKKIKPLG